MKTSKIFLIMISITMIMVLSSCSEEPKSETTPSKNEPINKLDELKNQATSDKPLSISNQFAIKKEESIEINIGFYNKQANSVKPAFTISKCNKGDSGIEQKSTPSVIYTSEDVKSSSQMEFNAIIDLKETNYQTGQYVCSLQAIEMNNYKELEQESFFLDVVE